MGLNRRKQYFVITGIGLWVIALIVLLISPAFIFSPTVTVIGSDLSKSEGNQITASTKTDFSDQTQIAAFPRDIGGWHGEDYDSTAFAKALNAPVALMIGYQSASFIQPMVLTIVQSKSNSSFHDPDYCFKFQGLQIQENAKEYLSIADQSWVNPQLSVTIPMNKLIVTRNSQGGEVYERGAVLYFYVKGNQYYSDAITMVQVQTLVYPTGSYDYFLKAEKDFISQIFPLMFQPESNTESSPVIQTLANKGATGYAGIIFILLIPLMVIAYPFLRR